MWNSLLKFTLVSYVWKRYRRTLIALPILLLYFWVVNLIHGDLIAYATINQDTSWVAWSFIVKWLFIFIGMGGFVLVHMSAKIPDENSLLESFKRTQNNKDTVFDVDANNRNDSLNAESRDAFERIRNKDTLKSKADFVLQKKNKP